MDWSFQFVRENSALERELCVGLTCAPGQSEQRQRVRLGAVRLLGQCGTWLSPWAAVGFLRKGKWGRDGENSREQWSESP